MLSRRAALKGGTAVACVVAASPATATHNSGQEVRLHDLALQHAQVYAAWARSVDETSDKETAFYAARPAHPAQLIGRVSGSDGEDRPLFIGRKHLDRWKDANLAMWGGSKHEPKILKRYQDDIAALEPYEAECEAVSKQIGLADAEWRQEALSNQLSAIQAKARACRATTFEGIKAKIWLYLGETDLSAANFSRIQVRNAATSGASTRSARAIRK